MRAAVYHRPGDMRIDLVPDPIIQAQTGVIAGKLNPTPVLDMLVDLDGVPAGYAAIDAREAIKLMVFPERRPL